jgi:antitoxin (DNA-binding transcriptional repressor) of toxin-antitoxin stability system
MITEYVSIKNAECNLEELLKRLPFGESIKLTSPEGRPVALLVSLKSVNAERKLISDWDAQMDELAQKVSRAWNGEKSAEEVLSEMRRWDEPFDASVLVASVIAGQTSDRYLAMELVSMIEDFPGIKLISLDLSMARRAAQVADAFDAALISWDQEMLKRCPAAVATMTPEG